MIGPVDELVSFTHAKRGLRGEHIDHRDAIALAGDAYLPHIGDLTLDT